MKKPRRRRFSASSEGTFHIEGPDPGQFVIDPTGFAAPAGAEEIEAPEDRDGLLPAVEEDGVPDSEHPAGAWPEHAAAAVWPLAPEEGAPTEPEYGEAMWPVASEEDATAVEPGPAGAPIHPLPSSRVAGARPSGARPVRRRRFPLGLAVSVSFVSLLAGGVAGYLLAGSRSAPVRVVSPAVPAAPDKVEALTAADQEALDAAYAALHANQFPQAEQLFAALRSKHPLWHTMDIEVGRTLLHQRNLLGARAALDAVPDHDPASAQASRYIGVSYNAEGSYPEAEVSFARAVALDPSQPDGYFLWGECLRAQGKLMDAMSKFRSALLRNEDETGAGVYRVKLWLCAIEANQEQTDGTGAQIDAALAQPLPPMEAFFAAAARDLKAGDAKAAADHLRRARERADSTVFLLVLSDPLFSEIRLKPEVIELTGSVPPATPVR